jgi:hypothetical protein
MERTEKVKLLDSIFNQGNRDSLKSLNRPIIYPDVIIFQQQGGGLLFSGRLNSMLPKRFQDVILDDKELDTMLLAGGNATTFLLPCNGRD